MTRSGSAENSEPEILEKDGTGGLPTTSVAESPKDVQPNSNQQYEVIERAVSLEHKRLEVQQERVKILRQIVEATESADKRQCQIQSERLASEERITNGRRSLIRIVIVFGGIALIAMMSFVLGMAFFGSDNQAHTAIQIIAEGAKAFGGAGAIFLIWTAFGRLFRNY
ncbi:MAG: hypothetical protein OXB95_05100 [Rhodobacteraceae bacterium]|nr:hypothetical protein [Paracoccaceae bacterium]